MIKILDRLQALNTLRAWIDQDGPEAQAYYHMTFPETPMDVEIDERETIIIVRNKVTG